MKFKAELRTEDFGSAGSRRLIRRGMFPAEMYGKKGNVHLVMNAHDFDLALRRFHEGEECEIEVQVETYKCIFKELQEDIMKGTILHADFQMV